MALMERRRDPLMTFFNSLPSRPTSSRLLVFFRLRPIQVVPRQLFFYRGMRKLGRPVGKLLQLMCHLIGNRNRPEAEGFYFRDFNVEHLRDAQIIIPDEIPQMYEAFAVHVRT